MKQKQVYPKQIWQGIRHEIPLCCILFYESAWHENIKNKIVEYNSLDKITNNQGIVLCPDCITRQLQKKLVDKMSNRVRQ